MSLSGPATHAAKRRVVILGGGIAGLAAAFTLTEQPGWAARWDITVYQTGWRLGGPAAGGRNAAAYGRIEEAGAPLLSGAYPAVLGQVRDCYAALAALGLRSETAPLGSFEKAFKPLGHVFAAQRSGGGAVAPWRLDLPARTRNTGAEPSPSDLYMALGHWLSEDEATSARPAITNLCQTILTGLARDGVPDAGFAAIDGEDLEEWLERHGAELSGPGGALVDSLYAALFALRRPTGEGLAAGVGLHFALRHLLCPNEVALYRPQASWGDAVLAPYYQVLRARGVRFRFFHALAALVPSADGCALEGLSMIRQAETLDGGEYEPLATVRNLPSWPGTPLWRQLKGGEAIAANQTDFEENPLGVPGERFMLKRGQDFDDAVLAVPASELTHVAGPLSATRPEWRTMRDNMRFDTRSSLQLWLTPPSAEYGWKEMVTAHNPDRPFGPAPLRSVALGAPGPAAVWSDVSELLGRAEWGFDDRPWSLARFTARLKLPGDSSEETERQAWIALLEERLPEIWPNMTDREGRFLWSALFDPEGREGVERLTWQHWTRESFLPAMPGSVHTRLTPGGSGVAGLTLAGEWTANPIGVACNEAAAASGMEAAAHLQAVANACS